MTKKTVYFHGIEFDVEYEYNPAEIGDGYEMPSFPESAEIRSIKHQKTEFLEMFDALDLVYKIEELVLKGE